MKKWILSAIFYSLVVLFSATLNGANYSIQDTKDLLIKVENTPKVSKWDDPTIPIESGSDSMRKIPEFVELQNALQTAWPETMDHLDEVASTDVSKSLLFVAMQGLPPDQYILFLKKMTDLVEQQKLKRIFLEWAIVAPDDKNVRGVLIKNSERPEVKNLARRIKALYPDGRMNGLCDGIISGKLNKSDWEAEEADMNTPKPSPGESSSINQPTPASDKGAPLPSPQAQSATEIEVPIWLYGIVILSAAFLIGSGFYLRSKK